MSAATPGQADGKPFRWEGTMAEFDAEVRRRWIESSERLGLDHGMPNAAAALAAQEPRAAPGIPLRSDAETAAMLRADLADAEAQLARWPKCPAGCSCRIGIEDDPDRNECGCDGPCNGEPQPAPGLAALREQARLARQDRDQLRTAVLSLAAKWSDESYAAHGGYADALSECASELRQVAEPPS